MGKRRKRIFNRGLGALVLSATLALTGCPDKPAGTNESFVKESTQTQEESKPTPAENFNQQKPVASNNLTYKGHTLITLGQAKIISNNHPYAQKLKAKGASHLKSTKETCFIPYDKGTYTDITGLIPLLYDHIGHPEIQPAKSIRIISPKNLSEVVFTTGNNEELPINLAKAIGALYSFRFNHNGSQQHKKFVEITGTTYGKCVSDYKVSIKDGSLHVSIPNNPILWVPTGHLAADATIGLCEILHHTMFEYGMTSFAQASRAAIQNQLRSTDPGAVNPLKSAQGLYNTVKPTAVKYSILQEGVTHALVLDFLTKKFPKKKQFLHSILDKHVGGRYQLVKPIYKELQSGATPAQVVEKYLGKH